LLVARPCCPCACPIRPLCLQVLALRENPVHRVAPLPTWPASTCVCLSCPPAGMCGRASPFTHDLGDGERVHTPRSASLQGQTLQEFPAQCRLPAPTSSSHHRRPFVDEQRGVPPLPCSLLRLVVHVFLLIMLVQPVPGSVHPARKAVACTRPAKGFQPGAPGRPPSARYPPPRKSPAVSLLWAFCVSSRSLRIW
jgi:hypothetical protein